MTTIFGRPRSILREANRSRGYDFANLVNEFYSTIMKDKSQNNDDNEPLIGTAENTRDATRYSINSDPRNSGDTSRLFRRIMDSYAEDYKENRIKGTRENGLTEDQEKVIAIKIATSLSEERTHQITFADCNNKTEAIFGAVANLVGSVIYRGINNNLHIPEYVENKTRIINYTKQAFAEVRAMNHDQVTDFLNRQPLCIAAKMTELKKPSSVLTEVTQANRLSQEEEKEHER